MINLIIHAPNIHYGGGGVLLSDLLHSIPLHVNCTLIVDERMELPENMHKSISVVKVKATLFNRLRAEFKLLQSASNNAVVLCFGNLPPLLKLPCFVATYFQNRFIIDSCSVNLLPFKARLRIFFEKWWLYFLRFHSNEYFVQTETMRFMLNEFFGGKLKVTTAPFYNKDAFYQGTCKSAVRFDFIYIATGEFHKNHFVLIDAWCLLGKDSIFPTLGLTLNLDDSCELITYINECVENYGIKITNLGYLCKQDVDGLIKNSSAMIYPSRLESYGLPLIEASEAGLPILASELDFVRDVINPVETFDPTSAKSIARAVKRFLGHVDVNHSYLTPSQFLKIIERKAL